MAASPIKDIGGEVVEIWKGLGLDRFVEQYGIWFLIGVAVVVIVIWRGPELIAAIRGRKG